MKKYLFAAAALGLLMSACGERTGSKNISEGEVTLSECGHDHSDEGHDHSHAGHDHTHSPENTGHSHNHNHDHSGHKHDHASHSHDHPDNSNNNVAGDQDHSDEIIFPVSQAQKTDFRVEVAELTVFSQVIRTGGRIMPTQGSESSLVAATSGIVTFTSANLSDGARVSKGQRLFNISSKNIASGDIVEKNRASYQKALTDFERAKLLLEDDIISKREYDETELAYLQAKAEYEALAGQSGGAGVSVSSPLAGYITSVSVRSGDYVETGQLLGVVSENRRLILRAEVPQRYLSRLDMVSSANFTVPTTNTTYSLSELDGRLLSVGRSTVNGTAMVPVIFEFNNTADIVSGTFVEVSLLGAQQHGVLTLPLTAVTEQQGLYYVYIQLDEEGYQKREVQLGPDDGVRVSILSGVKPGERVVTRGAINVKMAASSASIPHSHEH